MAQSLIRRTIIDMALRRQRPGSGSSKDFLLTRTARMLWPNLDHILNPLKWAVIGGVATRLYMPERVTDDFDVAISAADTAQVRQKLAAAGYEYIGELSIGGSIWRDKDGLEIDVIEGYESWWDDALIQAQGNRDAQGLPILPLSYLVMLKMKAGRLIDFGDLGRMLGIADAQALDEVRAVIARYAPEDKEDLESLIYLGKLEVDNVDLRLALLRFSWAYAIRPYVRVRGYD